MKKMNFRDLHAVLSYPDFFTCYREDSSISAVGSYGDNLTFACQDLCLYQQGSRLGTL